MCIINANIIHVKYPIYLNIWMSYIAGPKLSTTPLLFPVFIEFRIT